MMENLVNVLAPFSPKRKGRKERHHVPPLSMPTWRGNRTSQIWGVSVPLSMEQEEEGKKKKGFSAYQYEYNVAWSTSPVGKSEGKGSHGCTRECRGFRNQRFVLCKRGGEAGGMVYVWLGDGQAHVCMCKVLRA